ncbi:MAG: hypothetical protein Q9164_002321, partial [Protoblastenia rupestris]
MTLGSTQSFTNPKNTTSWCVLKWEEVGAIIIGKLNMHELGLGKPLPKPSLLGHPSPFHSPADTTGNNPVTGTPTNHHNPAYYPGGSSSASGTTVSSNLLPLTLGCDGGGSIRIPSAYCGIYGLKPTHSRISRSSSTNHAFSTSVIGPMASNMADLEIGYRILATPNPEDRVSAMFASPLAGAKPAGKNRQKVIGICKQWIDASAPSVQNICHDALTYFSSSGYEIVDIDLPYLHEGQLSHALTILSEIGTGVADCNNQSFTPSNKILLSVGAQTPAHDFLMAQKMRSLLMSHLSYLFQKHPGLLIVTPTTPNAGWCIGSSPGELKYGISDANMSVKSMT